MPNEVRTLIGSVIQLLSHEDWPVRWIDPAPAVARRVVELIGPATGEKHHDLAPAIFTSGKVATAGFSAALQGFGLAPASAAPLPAV